MLLNLFAFDIQTLVVVLIWGHFAAGVIVYLYKTSARDSFSSGLLNKVMYTRCLYSIGFLLLLLRDIAPGFISINIANTMFFVYIYIEVGLLLTVTNIYGKNVRIVETGILLISILAYNIFELYNEDPNLRLSVAACVGVLLCILPLNLLLFSKNTNSFMKKVSIFYFIILAALASGVGIHFVDDSTGGQLSGYLRSAAFIIFIIMMTINPIIYLLAIKKLIYSHIQRFNAIVSTVDAGIIVVDKDFVITDFNQGAEQLLGYSRDEVIGKTPKHYTPDEYYGIIDTLRDRVAKGEYISYAESMRRRMDGQLIYCSATYFPIFDENENVSGSVAILRDITENKQMEQAMKEATRAADEASMAKSVFLANMSHEIRTPLNGVIGFAELALDDEDTPARTKAYLDKIKSSAISLLDIVSDILDISKVESGKMELEKSPFDLHSVLNTCRTIVELKAKEKGIALHFYSEPLIGKKLVGDPVKLRQTLLNILSNAIKFTNYGVVKVRVVTEEETSENVVILFEVKDSGIGMSSEQIENIFEPFVRVDGSTTNKYGGAGLGLAITKSLVELMGGNLLVESAPGLGSRFYFTLAFGTIAVADDSSQQDAPLVSAKPVFAGDVLVCEDNRINQEVIVSHLSRIGLNPTVAENGRQGVEYARERMEQGNPYDLILMDIYMPEMDGLDATRHLVRMGNKAPIIALTANVLVTDKETYLQQGMVDFLGKPFTSQELWTCLSRHLTVTDQTRCGQGEQGAKIASDASESAESRFEGATLDEALGLQRASDDMGLYRRIVKHFVEDYTGVVDRLNEMADSGDLDLIRRTTHTLQSASRIIGAEKLANVAYSIEASLASGDASRLTEQILALDSALQELLKALPPVVAEVKLEKGDLDIEEALALVDELSPLLASGYTESTDFVDRIKVAFTPLGKKCSDLVAQIEDYEFEAAFETLLAIKSLLEAKSG
ncbi:MAG: ATP-binding protein [Betaproteobacteria bacterium]|nr:ATP-binding protein [Betaproteobacteria bacterium]